MKAVRVRLDALATLLKRILAQFVRATSRGKTTFLLQSDQTCASRQPLQKRWGECAFGGTKPPATVSQITVCCQKTAELLPVTFLQLYNGTWENTMFKRIKQLARKQRPPKRRTQPQPEEDLGGGDICSLQEQPSTDDDQPLD
jgi:hypothetical protein